jgi:protein-glutamine gamma-glutamyltransferase
MIKIQQHLVDDSFFMSTPFSESKKMILKSLLEQEQIYVYEHQQQLMFELLLREKIIEAAKQLANSKARFATFRFSRCNEQFWRRNKLGGFELREGVLPSEAINDIFQNSHLYAFECATAIVIVFYKAVLSVLPGKTFNELFANLLLYDWHYDKDLGIKTKKGDGYIPGDCLYFKNPEVDPQTPQWQGENTIYLGNGLHYGHGIGITTKEGIIESLNKRRKKYATKSAYLLKQTTRVDFKYLSRFAPERAQTRLYLNPEYFVIGKIGSATFLQ